MTGWRPLGQAQSAAERQIESVLARTAMKWESDLCYRRIAEGITNLNWLVRAGPKTYFVKIHGEGSDRFIERATALEASRRAGECGVGPRLLDTVADPGAEIFEHLADYRNTTSEDGLRPDVVAGVIRAFRTVHGTERLPVTRSGFEQLDDRLAEARAADIRLGADFETIMALISRARDAIERAGYDYVVSHNDAHTGNFMINPAGDVRVIDWEYASNNDAMWDLGVIGVSIARHLDPAELVSAYLGTPCARRTARVKVYQPIAVFSWSLWAAVQDRLSAIPFDYGLYAKYLHDLSRAALFAPDFSRALSEI